MNHCNLQQSRTVNPGEGGKSDSEAFNIIMFKCSLFNKNHKLNIKKRKIWPIQNK